MSICFLQSKHLLPCPAFLSDSQTGCGFLGGLGCKHCRMQRAGSKPQPHHQRSSNISEPLFCQWQPSPSVLQGLWWDPLPASPRGRDTWPHGLCPPTGKRGSEVSWWRSQPRHQPVLRRPCSCGQGPVSQLGPALFPPFLCCQPGLCLQCSWPLPSVDCPGHGPTMSCYIITFSPFPWLLHFAPATLFPELSYGFTFCSGLPVEILFTS